jgi:putative acetyltransferase
MSKNLSIRPEKEEDVNCINQIIKSAFQQAEPNPTEHLLVSALRDADALTLSLVAERDNTILGHIAFSEVTINGEYVSWYGLAPVSVDPEYQNQGIGSTLIEYSLNELRQRGARGCVVVGEPDYYKRFGFVHQDRLLYDEVPDQYFLVQSFGKAIPSGKVEYHDLFAKYG